MTEHIADAISYVGCSSEHEKTLGVLLGKFGREPN